MGFELRKGSAAHPARKGTCVIAHPVSVRGIWGSGTSQDISKRWNAPMEYFRPYTRWRKKELRLGMNLWSCEVVLEGFGEQAFYIVSMVCIDGRLEQGALGECLDNVAEGTRAICMDADRNMVRQASIHMPALKQATGVIRNCLKRHDVVLYERKEM